MIEPRHSQQSGFVMSTTLAMIVVMTIVVAALASMIAVNISNARSQELSQRAFNIAEAGANYYLWHLSHNPGDFKDGLATPSTPDPQLGYGPYTHDYYDTSGRKTGTYTLWIKPQSNGSTIATVRVIGKAQSTSGSSTRTVEVKIGAPSYASYGLLADNEVWFGSTESASGPIHSNKGIRLDGASDSDATSARSTYVPSASLGGNGSTAYPGVWCSALVTAPVNCNTRSKVDWRYPVPAIDFNQITGDLCTIKKKAFESSPSTASLATQTNACIQVPTTQTPGYLPRTSTTGTYSVSRGYLVTLNNNDTYDLERVTAVNDRLTPYTSALTRTAVASGVAIPSNRVIFAEDNIWLRTSTNYNNRVTIASGRLAQSTVSTHITLAGNVLYQDKDGTDVIGLVSEGSFYIAPYAIPTTSSFNAEFDVAVIAQNGDAVYTGSTYNSASTVCTRGWSGANQKMLFYGSVATRGLWTWTWVRSSPCGDMVSIGGGKYVSGVHNNTTQYDYNLLYSPPPFFPTTSTYNILEWREVVSQP